jgi:hypothetical protein
VSRLKKAVIDKDLDLPQSQFPLSRGADIDVMDKAGLIATHGNGMEAAD